MSAQARAILKSVHQMPLREVESLAIAVFWYWIRRTQGQIAQGERREL
jgi:hypothetical protein